jgi:bifunctional UDP-N-acetylglucosamine pyrophosphorylase/glucosamine-1-phosphate N-acetyltransferase
LTTEPLLTKATGTLVLLSGDVPLLSAETLRDLLACHRRTNAALSVLTAVVDPPTGYGRIVRSGGRIARIVEERDATPAERDIREINSGIYAFDLDGLFDALRKIGTENVQHEYYLPDLVGLYRLRGRHVETMTVKHPDEIQGINSRSDLASVSRQVREQKNGELMASGVTLKDPSTSYIDRDVPVGADTVIYPGVTLEGQTRVGERCVIHSGVRLTDSILGDDVIVYDHSVVANSTVQDHARVGPFAHLREGVTVGERAKVGNFVEMKKSALGDGSKAMHLSYLGDAQIGADVNIGAGTITCNYDGVTKHTTTIEDGAFIGSDSQLVAPVTVRKGAYVGTGTTVREDVPSGALAVSAGKQRNIEDWVEKKRKTRN